jgi:hypothetical protein
MRHNAARFLCLALFSICCVQGQVASSANGDLAADVAFAQAEQTSNEKEEMDRAEKLSLNVGSGVIFMAGIAMLGIIGYIVYKQHKRNVAKEGDKQLMNSLLDSEMDYAAM